jgi:hypothetical protein
MRGLALLALLPACCPPPTPVSLSTGANVPFVAFVDGDGAWTRVLPSSPGEYRYEVSDDRWGVAWTCDVTAMAVLLSVDEATELAEPCLAPPETAPFEGQVVGLAAGEQAQVALSVGGSDLTVRPDTPSFELDAPLIGEYDVAVQVLDPDTASTRVLLERGLQGSSSGITYDAADAVPLETRQVDAVIDAVGPVLSSMLVTRTGRFFWTGAGQAGDRTLFLPLELLAPDDIQAVIAAEQGFVDGNGRRVEVWRGVPADTVVPFPPRAAAPVIDVVSGAAGVHVRASSTELADAYWLLGFQRDLTQLPPVIRGQALLATKGWLDEGAPVDLVFPPVDGLAGWPDDVVLTEVSLEWRWSLRRANHGVTPLLPGHDPRLPEGDGLVRSFADIAGFAP